MYRKYSDGIIEVITGPMFSGKSEELIRRLSTFKYANISTLVVKPAIDDRWSDKKIISRNGLEHLTQSVEESTDIIKLFSDGNYSAVAVDEAQFFDENLPAVLKTLVNLGIRIIVSGLDTDFMGNPFGPMPAVLAMAEDVTKLTAVCVKCNNAATMTFRKSLSSDVVEVGNTEYQARCRKCHNAGTSLKGSRLKYSKLSDKNVN